MQPAEPSPGPAPGEAPIKNYEPSPRPTPPSIGPAPMGATIPPHAPPVPPPLLLPRLLSFSVNNPPTGNCPTAIQPSPSTSHRSVLPPPNHLAVSHFDCSATRRSPIVVSNGCSATLYGGTARISHFITGANRPRTQLSRPREGPQRQRDPCSAIGRGSGGAYGFALRPSRFLNRRMSASGTGADSSLVHGPECMRSGGPSCRISSV